MKSISLNLTLTTIDERLTNSPMDDERVLYYPAAFPGDWRIVQHSDSVFWKPGDVWAALPSIAD